MDISKCTLPSYQPHTIFSCLTATKSIRNGCLAAVIAWFHFICDYCSLSLTLKIVIVSEMNCCSSLELVCLLSGCTLLGNLEAFQSQRRECDSLPEGMAHDFSRWKYLVLEHGRPCGCDTTMAVNSHNYASSFSNPVKLF